MLYTKHVALRAAGLLTGNIFTRQPRGKSLMQESLPQALPVACYGVSTIPGYVQASEHGEHGEHPMQQASTGSTESTSVYTE